MSDILEFQHNMTERPCTNGEDAENTVLSFRDEAELATVRNYPLLLAGRSVIIGRSIMRIYSDDGESWTDESYVDASFVAVVDNRVDVLEAAISINNEAIDNNADKIDDHTEAIGDNTAAITANTAQLQDVLYVNKSGGQYDDYWYVDAKSVPLNNVRNINLTSHQNGGNYSDIHFATNSRIRMYSSSIGVFIGSDSYSNFDVWDGQPIFSVGSHDGVDCHGLPIINTPTLGLHSDKTELAKLVDKTSLYIRELTLSNLGANNA